ncbi:hypothetical protein [Kitasatospora griseola]|uniref:hypothetical protein n=1 Tax=Kitasatospora griseola TaxID=2064 RepID=UPI0016700682|nr:hypothetical protein [Kitasatospora griseola]GGR00613.1 hypothetical protein GCM10010195_65520 [Kitasatospora griseola]
MASHLTTTRVLLIGVALLTSVVVGIGGGLLHRIDHNTIPACIFQGGKTFTGSMTVCMSILIALGLLF